MIFADILPRDAVDILIWLVIVIVLIAIVVWALRTLGIIR